MISTINFSRSSLANLLPLVTALLYFGSSASYDLFRYHARMGDMPSYGTVMRAMRVFSEREAAVTLAHGRNPNSVGVIYVLSFLLDRLRALLLDIPQPLLGLKEISF